MRREVSGRLSGSWWHRAHLAYSLPERIADGVVHGIGILLGLCAGGALLALALAEATPGQFAALAFYILSLLTVLSVSLAYNMWPISPIKRLLARFDQAAIFLFIAGTYTPFLALIAHTPAGVLLAVLVWAASIIGIALKLIVPERFGRLAIFLYLGIGWSGVLAFQHLAAALPSSTLWLLLAGGLAYSFGIVFHLWEKLLFQNALWHSFVVAGAGLHLWAVFDCMVLKAA
jgi:hemolysin III